MLTTFPGQSKKVWYRSVSDLREIDLLVPMKRGRIWTFD